MASPTDRTCPVCGAHVPEIASTGVMERVATALRAALAAAAPDPRCTHNHAGVRCVRPVGHAEAHAAIPSVTWALGVPDDTSAEDAAPAAALDPRDAAERRRCAQECRDMADEWDRRGDAVHMPALAQGAYFFATAARACADALEGQAARSDPLAADPRDAVVAAAREFVAADDAIAAAVGDEALGVAVAKADAADRALLDAVAALPATPEGG